MNDRVGVTRIYYACGIANVLKIQATMKQEFLLEISRPLCLPLYKIKILKQLLEDFFMPPAGVEPALRIRERDFRTTLAYVFASS